MPFRSRTQARYLQSADSPLTPAQKKEFRAATNFKTLPERANKGQKQIVNPRVHVRKLQHG